MGYTNITVVKEQEQPDGHLPTCPYPNPEIKEAMALGIKHIGVRPHEDCFRMKIASVSTILEVANFWLPLLFGKLKRRVIIVLS